MNIPSSLGGKLDPLGFVQGFRRNAVNFAALWKQTGVPPGVQLIDPKQTPITDADLPADAFELVKDYRKSHPNVKMTWEKRMQLVDGTLTLVVEDESEMPPENALLTVSSTISLNTSDTAHMVTELFVASLE